MKTGSVPDTWLKVVIKPIPKGNNQSTIPSEYRGISLQSFIAKSYCRILNNRLREYIENNSKISDEQNGFRQNGCCQDHILTLTTILENRILQNRDTFACFINFRKAFDCVDRELLWRKLETRYSISGNFLNALKALYKKVRCAVDINHNLSECFDVENGVKQGCILSPSLFAMYIDDLVEQLRVKNAWTVCGECMVSSLLYADDIVLVAPDKESLEVLIKVVEEWCGRWRMNLNIAKTKILHFRKKSKNKTRSDHCFTFNSEVIEYVEQYKYLGLVLTEHLDWGKAIEEIHTKANRALALLNHRARSCGGLHFNTYSMLFNQLVHSIVMCNSCICLNLDIICINETFLLEGQEINVPGYKWFGNNRKHIARRACRGSGGVGMLIRTSILEKFDVAVMADKFEGILWAQLIHKSSKRSLGICACYLPPIGSSRGDHSADFFDSLKALIVENYNVEDFLICGDLNARCGEMEDIHVVEPENDPFPKRIAVDKTTNHLGRELISTLRALDMCIVNGCFNISDDGFTSISSRGMSVVDYIIPYKIL